MAEDKFDNIINQLQNGEQPPINVNNTNQGLNTEERGMQSNTFGLKSVNEGVNNVTSTKNKE